MNTRIQESDWNDQTSPADWDVDDKDSNAVRAEIDQTRSRLSGHIDKIQERLQPENIKQQAQEAIQNAMADSMESVKDYVDEYVQQVNWHDVRDSILDSVRSNPIPAALIGMGVGWIFLNGSQSQAYRQQAGRRGQSEPYPHGLGWREDTPQMESPSNAALRHAVNRPDEDALYKSETRRRIAGDSTNNEADSLVEQMKDGVTDTIDKVSTSAQQTLDENPLLFGAIGLLVGAGLGVMLPASRYENELVGDLRRQTYAKAQSVVDEVKDRANTVMNELQPDLEKVATTVVKNIEDVGKQAVGEVRHSLQRATEKLENSADTPNHEHSKTPQPAL